MPHRIFYCSGPGNIIESHRCWRQGEHNTEQVSVTFSGQVEDFCADIGASAYLIASQPRPELLVDEPVTLEHRPKPIRHGIAFHVNEVLWALSLLRTARRFGADIALIDSGTTHYFLLSVLRLFGIQVIPIQHNTLWPAGFPPRRLIGRLILWLDSWFWRRIPAAVIAVSPECERQVQLLRGPAQYPLFQARAQFEPRYFARIPPPPPHAQRPFRVLFTGRITRNKGVFDLLQIARLIEARQPQRVCWEICGAGADLDQLRRLQHEYRLQEVVHLHGWTAPTDLVEVYARCHAAIVPTTSSFTEGMAMSAVESILAGRPLITNSVVPALEVMRSACVEAKPDDVESYAQAVLTLASDQSLYERTRDACSSYQNQFYDRSQGLAAALRRAYDAITSSSVAPTSPEPRMPHPTTSRQ